MMKSTKKLKTLTTSTTKNSTTTTTTTTTTSAIATTTTNEGSLVINLPPIEGWIWFIFILLLIVLGSSYRNSINTNSSNSKSSSIVLGITLLHILVQFYQDTTTTRRRRRNNNNNNNEKHTTKSTKAVIVVRDDDDIIIDPNHTKDIDYDDTDDNCIDRTHHIHQHPYLWRCTKTDNTTATTTKSTSTTSTTTMSNWLLTFLHRGCRISFTFGNDPMGKYMCITVVPVLFESIYMIATAKSSSSSSLSSSSLNNLHNTAILLSILLCVIWNRTIFMNIRNSQLWRTLSSMSTSLRTMRIVVGIIILLSVASSILISTGASVPQQQQQQQSVLHLLLIYQQEIFFVLTWLCLLKGFEYHPATTTNPTSTVVTSEDDDNYKKNYFFASLHGIMTPGEWYMISSCLTYFGISFLLRTTTSTTTNEKIETVDIDPSRSDSRNNNNNNDLFAYTALSGLYGCILACSSAQILVPYTTTYNRINHWMQQQQERRRYRQGSVSSSDNNRSIETISSIIANLLRILYIAILTLSIIEGYFRYYQLYDTEDSRSTDRSNKMIMTIQLFVPKCLQWIWYDFLLQVEENVMLNRIVAMTTSTVTIRNSNNIWIIWFTKLLKLPRIIWLIYWFTVMLITIPLSPVTNASSTSTAASAISHAETKDTTTNATKQKTTKKHQWSPVIARKWFHFIAIVLFVPTTLFAPQLQSLSYAIAICVLLMIEVLRHNIGPLNDFYFTYLDTNKDSDSNQLVLSHIALIAGCAIPLWILQYVNSSIHKDDELSNSDSNVDATKRMLVIIYVQLWGVYVLGIGDSMGAIIGTYYGRYKWGNNRRTIEGSTGMLLSLSIVCLLTATIFVNATSTPSSANDDDIFPIILQTIQIWFLAVLFVTALEAYTVQIDNIILPIVGTILLLRQLY